MGTETVTWGSESRTKCADPKCDPPAEALLEAHRLREIALALGVHGTQAGGAGPGGAVGVERDGLRDGGRHQQEPLELARQRLVEELAERPVAEAGTGRADLTAPRRRRHRRMDPLHELADLGRRARRRFLLELPMSSRISW